MLTKGVINTVKAIDALSKQMVSIDRDRDNLIWSLKEIIRKEDPTSNFEYLEIISFSIVEEPIGSLQENGSYVFEQCDDSLFNPDSGSGIVFWPIENENKWLKLEYIW